MANLTLTFTTRKRWFFWPAFYAIGVLAMVGIVRDLNRAGEWLAVHAMRFEVD